MNDWTDGYVTEIPYSVNHFPEMAPAHLGLALLHLRLASPRLAEPFTYLELGFGQGLGLNLLAATHPQGAFFGNDFMPEHVAAAQALADHAGLSNLHLFADSFAQLRERDLPPMDYIVLHGVYTWVNAENRDIIVGLIGELLKPGGVVYVSYNCLPGWALKAPLQRFMSEFSRARGATAEPGSVRDRFHAARDLLAELDEADAAFFTHNTAARRMLRDIADAGDAYLLHEFAPQGWSPFYQADVARHLATAGLDFAGSARLFSNFPAWSLPPRTRALLNAEPDPGMRELLRDFAVQTQLRRDIYVRAPQALSPVAVEQGFRALRFALLRPPASLSLNCHTPLGEQRLERHHQALWDCLAEGPQDLEALLQLPAFAKQEVQVCIDAINMLLCLGYIGVAASAPLDAATRSRVHALNRALLAQVQAGERISGLASAALGAAVEIPWYDQLFIAAQDAGCMDAGALADFVHGVLRSAGKLEQGGEAGLARLQREAHNFLSYGDRFYRSLDLL